MTIYIGADHRGFQLKEDLKKYLTEQGHAVADLGNSQYDKNDDYPDFAKLVAEKVSVAPEESRGILICGSGAGVAIVANKFQNVRAALAVSPKHAFMLRNDEDVNVLTLSAEFTNFDRAKETVDTFLRTPFSAEPRHRRRVEKIQKLEQ